MSLKPITSARPTRALPAEPNLDHLKTEAKRRKIHLLIFPTTQAIETLKQEAEETNAILHVTC